MIELRKKKYGSGMLDNKIFNGVVFSEIFILLLDSGMSAFNGADFKGALQLNTICTLIYYIMNPFICLMWLLYTDFKINQEKDALQKKLPIYFVPFLINLVFSILSLFNGCLFSINEENLYKRGDYFFIVAIMSLSYLFSSMLITIRDVKKNGMIYERQVYIQLVVFPIAVIISSILQFVFFGISIIWATTMLVLLSVYIYLQNSEISTDHLTGLSNRRQFDMFLKRKTETFSGKNELFLLIIDLNDFKKINDTFGHPVGDEALKNTARIIRNTGNDDFFARTGGDEFAIIGMRNSEDEVKSFAEAVVASADSFNEVSGKVYKLSFSAGYALYKKGETESDFMIAADRAMYSIKKEYKKNKARHDT